MTTADPARAVDPGPLFQRGSFNLAAGGWSPFKIECDALTDEDWHTLALILAQRVPNFTEVVGVPRGGIPFAHALQAHTGPGGRILIVDDVWTTGSSMRQFIGENIHHHDGHHILRAVVFARIPTPSDVLALFTLAGLPAEEEQ